MVNQFLTAKVVVAFKAEIQTNGDIWKDQVDVRLTIGRRAEKRTVQGGDIDVLPAELINEGEFEVPMTTDVIETVNPPVNPDSLAFWINEIWKNGKFPDITIIKKDENRDANTATLIFIATVTEIVPGDKEGEEADEVCIVRFVPKTFTSFIRA